MRKLIGFTLLLMAALIIFLPIMLAVGWKLTVIIVALALLVIAILRRVLYPSPPASIPLDALLYQDLWADSLDLHEIAMALEEDLGREISAEEIEKWQTVQDVIDCAEGR